MIITISESEIKECPNESDLGRLVKEKWMTAKAKVENDYCIVCGKVSPYKRDYHVDWRIGYVDGAGQGCFQPRVCNYNH